MRPCRARHRERGRGPGDDERARRRAPGNGDRPRRPHSRCERCVRERDALPRPRLRRHALRLRLARLHGRRTGRSRRRRAVRRVREQRPRRDRGRERGRVPSRHGRVRAVPRAWLPPDCDLRDLRRSRVRVAAGRPRRRDHDACARNRRLDGLGPVRVPRRRDSDEADSSGVGRARRPSRDAARPPRRRRAAVRARGQVRGLPRLPRRRRR